MKKKIARVIELLFAGAIVGWGLWLLYMTQVPTRVNGWKLNCLAGLHGSMSMATENSGYLPYQFYYTKAAPKYLPGDDISFYNRDKDPENQGMTLKRLSYEQDGVYHLYGLSKACSGGKYTCHFGDIEGKVVSGPYPLLPIPKAYWRWLTLNWTLNYDDIDKRFHSLVLSPVRVCSKVGRLKNKVCLKYPSSMCCWNTSQTQVVINDGDHHQLNFAGPEHWSQYDFPTITIDCWPLNTSSDNFGWVSNHKFIFTTGGSADPKVWEWTPKNGLLLVKTPQYFLQSASGLRAQSNDKQANPILAFDGNLNTGWAGQIPNSGRYTYNWLVRDLGKVATVTALSAMWTGGESLSTEFSVDGKNWTTRELFSPPPSTESMREVIVKPPIVARYIRIGMRNDKTSLLGDGMTLFELQVN